MSIDKLKIAKLSQGPGVYFFRNNQKEIIYIGKATNLRSRVGSYFRGGEAGRLIGNFISEIAKIGTQETDSVLEALILESNLIKKYQPRYNIKEKDDKSFSYFVITDEDYPRVLIMRKTDIESFRNPQPATRNAKINVSGFRFQASGKYGPYGSKKQMELALKIIRRIFPFHSLKQDSEQGCLDFQLGRCPGPYAGAISKADYAKNIRGIKMILEGKKKSLLSRLEKEMKSAAKAHDFEKAAELRNKLFALRHINDVALISEDKNIPNTKYPIRNTRVEAYDISNISGDHAVGSMVVFKNGEADKSQYRKFKIKTVEGSDDVGMMREVLLRRFQNDWAQPDLILLDGGKGHLNMAEKLLRELGFVIPMVAVAKGVTRKGFTVHSSQFADKNIRSILKDKNLAKRIMDEAHRFAIAYHRKVRRKSLLS